MREVAYIEKHNQTRRSSITRATAFNSHCSTRNNRGIETTETENVLLVLRIGLTLTKRGNCRVQILR